MSVIVDSSVCMNSLMNVWMKHTHSQPGEVQHSVELSGWGAGWSGVSGKLKVEDEHDDQAIFILQWYHVDFTV